MTIPAELPRKLVRIGIDTREQTPPPIPEHPIVRITMATGDYCLADAQHLAAVERKSESDLLACIGRERDRFDREVVRLLAYPVRALVVESSWARIEAGEWQSKVTPAAAMGSLVGWIAMGLPIVMAGDHENCGKFISRILYTAARRQWRTLRAMLQAMEAAA